MDKPIITWNPAIVTVQCGNRYEFWQISKVEARKLSIHQGYSLDQAIIGSKKEIEAQLMARYN